MRGAVRQEFLRLRTIRSTWLLSIASLVLTVIGAVAVTLTAGSMAVERSGAFAGGRPLGDQQAFASALSSGSMFTPLLMGLLGAFAFGHEYRHGTIRPLLTTVPRRAQVAVAKVLGVAVWSAAVGILGVAASTLVAVLLGAGRFAPGVGPTGGPTERIAAGTVLYIVLVALVGLGLGWLLRNVPATVTLLLVLPLVAEPLLRAVLSIRALHVVAGAGRFLPFGAGARLYAYSTQLDPDIPAAFRNDLSPLAGGVTLTVVAAVLLAVAHLLFERRDA